MNSIGQSHVVTVRMSPALHAELRKLAYARETSMNTLVTSMIANAVNRYREEQSETDRTCACGTLLLGDAAKCTICRLRGEP